MGLTLHHHCVCRNSENSISLLPVTDTELSRIFVTIHGRKAFSKTSTSNFRHICAWNLTLTSSNMPFSRGASHLRRSTEKGILHKIFMLTIRYKMYLTIFVVNVSWKTFSPQHVTYLFLLTNVFHYLLRSKRGSDSELLNTIRQNVSPIKFLRI